MCRPRHRVNSTVSNPQHDGGQADDQADDGRYLALIMAQTGNAVADGDQGQQDQDSCQKSSWGPSSVAG